MREDIDIKPYLNPGYWDGHSLGVGETHEYPIPAVPGSTRMARLALGGIRPDAARILASYTSGDQLDPHFFNNGTVVLYRNESLHGPLLAEDYDVEALQQQPIPIQETAAVAGTGLGLPSIQAYDAQKRHYMSIVEWGVILGKAGEKALFSRSAVLLYPNQSGYIETRRAPFDDKPLPTKVGQVMHRGRESRGYPYSEDLWRITALHVIEGGIPQEVLEKSSVKSRWNLSRLLPTLQSE